MIRITIIALLLACAAHAQKYVYSADGATVTCAPRELPSVGVIIGTDRAVLNLHAATPEKRAQCGWYSVEDVHVIPVGCRVTGSTWTISGTVATHTYTYAQIPERGYEISKYRIIDQLDEMGKLDAFIDLISADAKLKARWDAAILLDSTNALLAQAKAAMTSKLGISADDVTRILNNARVK